MSRSTAVLFRDRIRIPVLTCLALALYASECLGVRSYQPVQPDPVLEPWRWRSFAELKGLGLRCIAEDRDGAMWFGVEEGVMRYDGVTRTLYTPEDGLLGAPVIVLLAARDGSVYAGTHRGISHFHKGAWRQVVPLEGDMPWPTSDLMEAADGSVWAGTSLGALRLGAGGAVLYTTQEMGAGLRALAPEVRISIVPEGAATSRPWPEGTGVVSAVGVFPGLDDSSIPGIILSLAPGGSGEAAGLKVGDRITAVDGKAYRSPWHPERSEFQFSGPAHTPVTLTVQREGNVFDVRLTRAQIEGIYHDFRVFDVYEDREGVMWFGLFRGEIVRCDARGASPEDAAAWRLYTEEDGLERGWWPRILQTRDRTLWTVSDNSAYGVNRFDGKIWTNFRLRDLGGSDGNTSLLETADGTLWIGSSGILHAFRKGMWRMYRSQEVPTSFFRDQLLETSDGALWVASLRQEAFRLDLGPSQWTSWEGLHFQCETPDGALWFVSQDRGVVRYDGRVPSTGSEQAWTRYGTEDGLMDSPSTLLATREGVLWAAGSHDRTPATARFDGRKWSRQVHPEFSGIPPGGIYESSDGALWVASTWPPEGQDARSGLLRFDGRAWTHYTPREGALRATWGIGQTPDGVLWFGGQEGLVRFDGRTWTPVEEPEELTTIIEAVYASPGGELWVGTSYYGVLRFDGQAWTRYDVQDGLADNWVAGILQTGDGTVWAATGKGVSRFDGQAWATQALPLDLRYQRSILRQSRDGALWINRVPTETGRLAGWLATRYVPDTAPPETEITLSLKEVSQPGNTTLAWRGADPWGSTPDSELQFSTRLDQGPWSPFSGEETRIFQALGSGKHTVEVRARDRDFNVDQTPAMAAFTVVPPVWQEPWFIGLMAVFVGITSFQASRIVASNRRAEEARQRLIDELEEELQTAHELQMGLMPTESPRIKGFALAGRCLPANHVGGDLFQYYPLAPDRLAISLADVTGHAMEAAIPAVLFSGILRSQIELGDSLEALFARLNRTLCNTLTNRRTFVCFLMGELEPSTRRLRLANSGCPYPYLYRASTQEVEELVLDAYPLGIRADTHYRALEVALEGGDYVVFCSDGLIEATNASEELFGFERLGETIRQGCREGLSSASLIDRLIGEVQSFAGEAPQGDDRTCVAIRVG